MITPQMPPMESVPSRIVSLLNETSTTPPWWRSGTAGSDPGPIPDWADDVVSQISAFVGEASAIDWVGMSYSLRDVEESDDDGEFPDSFIVIVGKLIVVSRVGDAVEEGERSVSTVAYPVSRIREIGIQGPQRSYRTNRVPVGRDVVGVRFAFGPTLDRHIVAYAATAPRRERLLAVARGLAALL